MHSLTGPRFDGPSGRHHRDVIVTSLIDGRVSGLGRAIGRHDASPSVNGADDIVVCASGHRPRRSIPDKLAPRLIRSGRTCHEGDRSLIMQIYASRRQCRHALSPRHTTQSIANLHSNVAVIILRFS